MDRFSKLVSLVVDNNEITHLTDFPYLPSLTTLWLNNNKIEDLEDALENISHLPLKSVSFLKNPCCPTDEVENQLYRYTILSKLPSVIVLDTHQVSVVERNEANKRKKIKEAFGKYNSDPESEDEFENKVKRVVKSQVKEIQKQAVVIQEKDILDDDNQPLTPMEAFQFEIQKQKPLKESKSSIFEDYPWDKK